MTSCSDIRELLGPYLDGELSERDRKRVREHLDSCPDCSAEFAILSAMDEGLREEARAGEPGEKHLEALAAGFSQRFDLASARAQWQRPPRKRPALPASWLPPSWSPAVRIAFVTAALAGVVIIARQVGRPTAVPPVAFEQMPLHLKHDGADAVRPPESKPPGTVSEEVMESDERSEDGVGVIEAEKEAEGARTLEEMKGAYTQESMATTAAEAQEPAARGDATGAGPDETGPPQDASELVPPPRPALDAGAPPVQGSRRPQDRLGNEDRPEMAADRPSPSASGHVRGGRSDEVAYEVDSVQMLPPGPDRGRLVGFFREILAGMGAEKRAEVGTEAGRRAAAADRTRGEETSVTEPSLLEARETDPSLPDSVWIRMWRATAHSLADQALQGGRLEDCEEALRAYWRISHRAGKELAPDSPHLADLYLRDRERLEALLDCATR